MGHLPCDWNPPGSSVRGLPPGREGRFAALWLVLPEAGPVTCRTPGCRVSCDIPMPLARGCRDWARERPQSPDPEGKGTWRSGAPAHVAGEEARAARPPKSASRAAAAVLPMGKSAVRERARRGRHALLQNKQEVVWSLWAERHLFYESPALGALTWNTVNCLCCVLGPREAPRPSGHWRG